MIKKQSCLKPVDSQIAGQAAVKSLPCIEELKEKYKTNYKISSFSKNNTRRQSMNKSVIRQLRGRNWREICHDSLITLPQQKGFRDFVMKAVEDRPLPGRLNTSRNQLAQLGHQARVKKFRRIASNVQKKVEVLGAIKEIVQENDLNIETPEKPLFCTTLSAEAQYAMFKGYEDILFDKITSLRSNNEKFLPLKRTQSPKVKPSVLLFAISPLKNQQNNSLKNSNSVVITTSYDNKEITNPDVKRKTLQRYMSVHFKHAMNILDEVKKHETNHSFSTQKLENIITQKKLCKQFSRLSESLTKQFEFVEKQTSK